MGVPRSSRCTCSNKVAWLGTAVPPNRHVSALLPRGKVRQFIRVTGTPADFHVPAFATPRCWSSSSANLHTMSIPASYRGGLRGAHSALAQQVVEPRPACSSAPWRSGRRTDPCTGPGYVNVMMRPVTRRSRREPRECETPSSFCSIAQAPDARLLGISRVPLRQFAIAQSGPQTTMTLVSQTHRKVGTQSLRSKGVSHDSGVAGVAIRPR